LAIPEHLKRVKQKTWSLGSDSIRTDQALSRAIGKQRGVLSEHSTPRGILAQDLARNIP
jgi:hypothetical protein